MLSTRFNATEPPELGEKIRIVQLIAGSSAIGGAQTHVRDLSAGLRARGHECIVITGPPEGLFHAQLRDQGIPYQIVPGFEKDLDPRADSLAFFRIVSLLRRVQPALVACHSAKAGFLGRMAGGLIGVRSVFTPHGWSFIDRESGRIRPFFRQLEKIGAWFGGAVIAVCEEERRLAVQAGVAPSRGIAVVHNGIPDLGCRAGLAGIRAGQTIVLTMVARFQRQKDHATLLHALKKLQHMPWTLRLAGDGPLQAAAKTLCHQLGLQERVNFLGETGGAANLLASSQALVLCTFWEAFPISVIEGMRAGLPIVATNVGGIGEAIQHGVNGLLVPLANQQRLAEALARIIQDPDLRARLGESARRSYVASFTSDQMTRQTLGVYRQALQGSEAGFTARPSRSASHSRLRRSRTPRGRQTVAL